MMSYSAKKRYPFWVLAALDTLLQLRLKKHPLAQIVAKVAKNYNLGATERRLLNDVVFSYTRYASADLAHLHSYFQNNRLPVLASNEEKILLLLLASKRAFDDEVFAKHAQELILDLSPAAKKYWELYRHFFSSLDSSYPSWFIQKIKEQYQEHSEDLLKSLKERAYPVLAFDSRMIKAQEIIAALEQIHVKALMSSVYANAIKVVSHEMFLSKLPEFISSSVWLMDEASQWVASQVACRPSDKVLDLCSGGGGKTRFLACTGAPITAVDISKSRLAKTKARFKERNDKVQFICADARTLKLKAEYDWILVDAPCSGTGVLRREPDRIWRLEEKEITDYARLQYELLCAAAQWIKPHGSIIYATCSILKDENEAVIERFLKKNASFVRLIQQRTLLPSIEQCDGFFFSTI